MDSAIHLPPIGAATFDGVGQVLHLMAHLNLFASLVLASAAAAQARRSTR